MIEEGKAEGDRLREESAALAADENDRAEIRAVREEMDALMPSEEEQDAAYAEDYAEHDEERRAMRALWAERERREGDR